MFSDIKHAPNPSPARWRSGQAPFNSLLSCETAPTSEHSPPPLCGACRPLDFIRGYIFSYVKLFGLELVVNSLLRSGRAGVAARRGRTAGVPFSSPSRLSPARRRHQARLRHSCIMANCNSEFGPFCAEPGRCLRMGRIFGRALVTAVRRAAGRSEPQVIALNPMRSGLSNQWQKGRNDR